MRVALSAEGQLLIQQIGLYLVLPIGAWLSYQTALLVEKKQNEALDDERQPHRLVLTSRFAFVLAGLVLLGAAAKNFASAPLDYLWISAASGCALLLYPLVSNLIRLKTLGFAGFAAQLGLAFSTVAAAYFVWVGLRSAFSLSAETLQEYVSLLTWQVLALLAGIVFFPQLYRLMGGVREFNLFGFRGRLEIEETQDAEEEAEQEAKEVFKSEGAKEALQEVANEQADSPIERYKAAMKVWSVVAYIVRDLAVANKSTYDAANQTREQIQELLTQKILTKAQVKRATKLLDLRNQWKRNPQRPIEQEAFNSFMRKSRRLGNELSRLISETNSNQQDRNEHADVPQPPDPGDGAA